MNAPRRHDRIGAAIAGYSARHDYRGWEAIIATVGAGKTSTSTGTEGISEVLFRVGQWWNDAVSGGLLDKEVTSVDGWRVLGALRSGDGHTMSEISAAMSIPPPSLTRIVDKLVDGGFVVRRVDAMDRRRVLIYLSARGKAKVRKLTRYETLAKATLIEEFGEDAAVGLMRSLARMTELPVPGHR